MLKNLHDPLSPIRMVVVGTGWAGCRQIEAAREIAAEIAVVGVVDSDRAHAASVANAMGVPSVFASLENVVDRDDVDAVSICTPHLLHRRMVIAAAEAGKDVLCEKPIALTVGDADAMNDAADRVGAVLFVNEQDVFEPVVDQLIGLIAEPEFGEFVSASLQWGFAAEDFSYPGRRAWLTDPDAGGTGTWMLHGIHKVAQVRAILGDVRAVSAVAHTSARFVRRDIEGSMRALMELEGGGAVDVLVTSESPVPERWSWTLCGTGAVVTATACSVAVHAANGSARKVRPVVDSMSSYARTLEAFAAAVRTRRPGRTSGRSEARSLAVVLAAADAARTGTRVLVPSGSVTRQH